MMGLLSGANFVLYCGISCFLIVQVFSVCKVPKLEPNHICDLGKEEGELCDPTGTPMTRFYHAEEPDEDTRITGCQPFRYNGCGANYNNYIAPLECISYCQTFTDIPLRSDIRFTVSHDADDEQPLLLEHFRTSLFPMLAELSGCIEEEMVNNVWVDSGARELEIDISFRIEDGQDIRPYESVMAFTTNLDNGFAVWTYTDPESNDVINLSAIPELRVVQHYTTRWSEKDSSMLLILLVVGLVISVISLLCLGCLVKAMKKMKMNIQTMRQKLIMGGGEKV